jgi:hypothetical protein
MLSRYPRGHGDAGGWSGRKWPSVRGAQVGEDLVGEPCAVRADLHRFSQQACRLARGIEQAVLRWQLVSAAGCFLLVPTLQSPVFIQDLDLPLVDAYGHLGVQRCRQRRIVFLLDNDEPGVIDGACFLPEVAERFERQRLQIGLFFRPWIRGAAQRSSQ